jgi:hypothetical protein
MSVTYEVSSNERKMMSSLPITTMFTSIDDNVDVIFSPSLLSNIVVTGNDDITMPIAIVHVYIKSWI